MLGMDLFHQLIDKSTNRYSEAGAIHSGQTAKGSIALMHLFLLGQASRVIELMVVSKCHYNSICHQGSQFFVLAVIPSGRQIRNLSHGCNSADT